MSNRRVPHLIILIALAAAVLACSVFPSPAVPTPAVDSFATAVALTLTALQNEQPKDLPTDIPAAPPAPSDTPAPTSVPGTATPLPMPPGLRIAYTDAARNLWLFVEGGANTRLVGTGDVTEGRISPDGNLVAYVRTADYLRYSLWVITPDGSGERQLISTADFDSMKNHSDAVSAQPLLWEFIPGTRTIAFTSGPTYDGPGMITNDDLWTVDTGSGVLTRLLAPGWGGFFYISPDGSQMALATSTRLSLINIDGSNRRDGVLTYPPVITYSEYQWTPAPKWSADSSKLRVAVPPADPLAEPLQYSTIYEVPVSGASAFMTGAVITQPLVEPAISPDLSRVAYTKVVGSLADNRWDLRIANFDGSSDVVYATGQPNFRGWAPDSTRFVFIESGSGALRIGQAGSAPTAMFSDVSSAVSIDWLADGRALVLTRSGSGWELRAGIPGGSSALLVSIPGDPSGYFPNYDIW